MYGGFMIVSLTGTPGTGKSTIANNLSKFYTVTTVEELARRHGCVIEEEITEDGRTTLIDVEELAKRMVVHDALDAEDVLLIEGHLSHLLPVDLVVVLRCNPLELVKRLRNKGWSEKKIKENVSAEVLDVILVESVESGRKVYEVDTTNKTLREVTEIVIEIIEAEKRGMGIENFKPGAIDWISDLGDGVDEFLI
jgi:adenylate kinase